MIAQKHLNLSISQRTVLVTVDMVRAARGVDADTITGLVDAGELRWVWDVGIGRRELRELRFWAREIIAPEFCRELTAEQAIAGVLGSDRTRWRGTEISHLLLVSRAHICRLHAAEELPGTIVDGTLWVQRPALVKFLTERLQVN